MPIFIATYIKDIPIGISNYLKNVFSCYRLNTIVKNPTNAFIDDEYKHIFSSIYKNENMLITLENFKDTHIELSAIESVINLNEPLKLYKVYDWKFYINDNIKVKPFCHEYELFKNIENMIDCRYDNVPLFIRDIYIDIIHKFDIHDVIVENVAKNIKNINEQFLGVHIRTWKHLSGCPYRYINYLKYRTNYIEQINNSEYTTVFICTDNRTEIEFILECIDTSKKILFYEYNTELNQIQNDFSELLLLSKSAYLIGSVNSTFTELAWYYSKCTVPVSIV